MTPQKHYSSPQKNDSIGKKCVMKPLQAHNTERKTKTQNKSHAQRKETMSPRTKPNHHSHQETDTNRGGPKTPRTSAHRPFSASNLGKSAVDGDCAVDLPVAVWTPKALRLRAVLRLAGTVGVFGSFRTVGVISIRLLRLATIWLLGLLAIRVLVLVLGNVVLVLASLVPLVPRALFASLLAHGDCVAEAVEGTLLLLAAEEHEVAGLAWV
jgi:hypothetical protein